MQKWKDRPPSRDPFDAAFEASDAIIGKHASLIAKAAPPLVGFGIFLLYFYRNRFYPSFDLFQFSSLLLAAAVIGFVIVGVVVLAMFVPGAMLFRSFLNTTAVKERVQEAMPSADDKRDSVFWQMVGLVYFGPFCFCALGLLIAALVDASNLLWTALLWPAVTAVLFGTLVTWRFNLGRNSIYEFTWVAYLSQLAFVVLLLLVLQNSAPVIGKLGPSLQNIVIWTIPVLMAALVTLCSMAHFGGWKVAIHFTLFFGLLVAGFSGALTTLPEKTVKSLGLGAYEAEIIMLDPAFCNRDLSELGIAEDCTLRNVHVVWSFGDAILLRPSLDEARHVEIPTEFVRSIVQSAGRGK
ncbi:hypothetical protein DT594_02850 [Halopseudomonas laoshanensis]|uniref:Uncharacterized protein n=1 Tax=Halopseudomonas laoshanensis TaxID=2268758 RepID=A0A7V7KX53_9GAMM|nr:hypothetical protein [Halopseudomonas laoshanensis]KAA0696313.1 hypothetical protein DT594_02850 [Halopseudomonas laoshanensis]